MEQYVICHKGGGLINCFKLSKKGLD